MKWVHILYIILLFTLPATVFGRRCSRYPSNTFTSKSPVDENFGITITGNVQTYILGQSYNVSLHAYNGHRFISAKLVLENENGEKSFGEDLGHLEVIEPVQTRYSQQCVNMIESTNSNPKARLDVVWAAPTEPGNGCVLIRATVLQHRDVWFMDDGGLTKRICEEVVDDVESQKKDLEETPCCICDEARYELIFEGLWSRNLHPKNFPTSGWSTRFTDILGAAHTSDYRFWDKAVLASPEMKEFAEHGSTLGLEREFNQYFREGKIRTVIKARGPAFPYISTPSVASVRVDPLHHQLSVASKIMPSPDWIVGVPGLELCLPNCTWLEEKVINLYPWDIGTDAGPTYTSPDQPQFPADVVRRMSSEYPPDPRSPFFDESHVPMKPLATLTIRRQRLYERKCEDEDSNNPDGMPSECFTHPWTAWSKCTAECGQGRQYRTRVFKQPDVAKIYNCEVMVKRKEERECEGEKCSGIQTNYAYDNQMNDSEEENNLFEPAIPQMSVRAGKNKAECKLGKWSKWSQCNVTCGVGMMERTRQYNNKRECQGSYYIKLNDYKTCQGKNCLGQIAKSPDNADDEDNFELNSFAQDYNQVYRTAYKPYKPFNSLPEHNDRKHLQNNQYGKQDRSEPLNSLEPVESNYNDQNSEEKTENEEQEKEQLEQEYSFPAEDLRQETIDEHFTNKQYSIARSSETFDNKKPFYQSAGSKQIHQKIQSNYATQNQKPFRPPPEHCYQPLNIMHECTDPRVIGNFWFYNYCTDECMLYATDICDSNRNKFLSLQQCEKYCALPMRSFGRFLRQKQVQGCRRARPDERNFKKRRDYYD